MADILAPEIVSELGEGPIWSDGRTRAVFTTA